MSKTACGVLYVVATPIGNLSDITERARSVLGAVDRIAAEDTRHTRGLLSHLGISKPMLSLHEHNEREQSQRLLDLLQAGESIALVSDAGTPLISDPGYHLVRQARAAGFSVVPVPGVSALVTALSVSGLPTDRFRFEGFLPAKAAGRRERLQSLVMETATLVFYESSHRIQACLDDLCVIFGDGREAVLARELTKTFETILGGKLGEMRDSLQQDANQRKGEFVVIVHGAEAGEMAVDEQEIDRMLRILLQELPVKQAASLAAKMLGRPKNELYQKALVLKAQE